MATVNFARNPLQIFLGLVLILCLWHSLDGDQTKTDIFCPNYNFDCLDFDDQKVGVVCVQRQFSINGCKENGDWPLILIKCKYYFPTSGKVRMTTNICIPDS